MKDETRFGYGCLVAAIVLGVVSTLTSGGATGTFVGLAVIVGVVGLGFIAKGLLARD